MPLKHIRGNIIFRYLEGLFDSSVHEIEEKGLE